MLISSKAEAFKVKTDVYSDLCSAEADANRETSVKADVYGETLVEADV